MRFLKTKLKCLCLHYVSMCLHFSIFCHKIIHLANEWSTLNQNINTSSNSSSSKIQIFTSKYIEWLQGKQWSEKPGLFIRFLAHISLTCSKLSPLFSVDFTSWASLTGWITPVTCVWYLFSRNLWKRPECVQDDVLYT